MSDDSNCFRDMFAQHYDFLKKGTFTDVSFKIGTVKIGAHKAVLASCSKVFRAMFEAEMKESQTQEVEISDVDEEAFGVFLDYIYARTDENLEKHLAKLFMLADKYDIPPLVNSCEQFMKKSLSMSNAFEYLQIADLYRREDSKKSITGFIKQNLDNVIYSDKWEELKEENPTLVSAVILSLMNDRDRTNKIASYDDINRKLCDAVVKIGTEEFPIHKLVLAEKSEQFLELFGDSRECQLESVTVADFKVLMEYVYLNKLPDKLADDGILKAAVKFKLQELVDHCVSILKRKIQLDNAVPTLVTAQSLRLPSLKSSAMEYILNNLDAVKNEDNWKVLIKYPDLLTGIYIKTG